MSTDSLWLVLTVLPASLHHSTSCIDPLPVASSIGEVSLQPVPVMCSARFCATPVAVGDDLYCTSSALMEATVSVLRLSQRGGSPSQTVSKWSGVTCPVIHSLVVLSKGLVASCMSIDAEKVLSRIDPLVKCVMLIHKTVRLEIITSILQVARCECVIDFDSNYSSVICLQMWCYLTI